MRAAAGIVFLLHGMALAEEPTVHVRARTRLEIGTTDRTASGIALEGTLVDEASNEGVADEVVRIELEGADGRTTRHVTTSATGTFRVELPGALGPHRLRAQFVGDYDHASAVQLERTLDLSRRPVSLALQLPRHVGLEQGVLPVEVTAREGGHGVALNVELLVNDVTAGPLALAATGRGAIELRLPPAVVAGSPVTVRARFAGDAQRDAAEAARGTLVTAHSRLEASLVEVTVPRGQPLVVTGTLGDARGLLEGERVQVAGISTLTDEKGQFRLELPTERAQPGPLAFEVFYRPPYPFRDEARRPLRATVLPPRPVPLTWYLAVPSLLAGAFAGVWLWRRRPWRRWRRLWAVRLRRPARAASATARRASAGAGVVESRPPRMAALRRATDCGLDGVVWDVAFEHAIGDARLTVSDEIFVSTDEHGRFRLDLTPGTWRITVSAPGYLEETFERALPHHGELRGLRVRLQPIRARVLALYATVARPLLPDAKLWATWTPRELLDHVRERARPGPPALIALTDLVEETYYSGRVPASETLARAEALAARLAARPPGVRDG